MNTVMVTGGLGYIGSHTCIELISKGFDVVILDNFSNSHYSMVDKIELITKVKISRNVQSSSGCHFYYGDVRNETLLENIFQYHSIDCVIHFAGDKSVNESLKYPIEYYQNGVFSSSVLLDMMMHNNVKSFIFSSSANIYGNQPKLPINENAKIPYPQNPYGRSKFIVENMLEDIYRNDKEWKIISLRYFNPIGSHPSYLLSENPQKKAENIMPAILKVAKKEQKELLIFGDDFETPDGSGVRDYIHVVDLAMGHIAALNYLQKLTVNSSSPKVINLGTGNGVSVLELIKTFEEVNNVKIPYKIVPRRNGDFDASWACVKIAKKLLNWSTKFDIADMCRDSWRSALRDD